MTHTPFGPSWKHGTLVGFLSYILYKIGVAYPKSLLDAPRVQESLFTLAKGNLNGPRPCGSSAKFFKSLLGNCCFFRNCSHPASWSFTLHTCLQEPSSLRTHMKNHYRGTPTFGMWKTLQHRHFHYWAEDEEIPRAITMGKPGMCSQFLRAWGFILERESQVFHFSTFLKLWKLTAEKLVSIKNERMSLRIPLTLGKIWNSWMQNLGVD